ncbi:MAG: sulfurtransferase TusA family protein [Bilophila sp.]
MRTVDTRGLSCPQPLILFHQALAENAAEPLDVLVDNEASLENVTRAAEKRLDRSRP